MAKSIGMGTVYTVRDRDQAVLYVGKTLQQAGRFDQHKKQDWWLDASIIELEHCPREQLDALERQRIRERQPAFNKLHVTHYWDHR